MSDTNQNSNQPPDDTSVDVVIDEVVEDAETPSDVVEEVVVVESEDGDEESDTMTSSDTSNDPEESFNTPENEAMTMLKLDSLIKRYISSIDKLKEEMKTHRAMFQDAINNDAAFSENEAKAKEANRIKNAAKQQIVKQPAVAHLQDKIVEVKEEIRDMQDALVDYLQEYERISGATFIETEDGIIHDIVKSVRLVKKGASGKKR